jgi:5-methylcytosine-specific restriction endonuclease McrA
MAEDSRSQFRAASDLYEVQPGAKQQVDHIITKARGGTDDPSNLQALCRECHSRKTAMMIVGEKSNRFADMPYGLRIFPALAAYNQLAQH